MWISSDAQGPCSCMLKFAVLHAVPYCLLYTNNTILEPRASYCEIYNERLYDLLKWTQQPLAVRWSAARGFHVPDLALRPCPSMAELLKARGTPVQCTPGHVFKADMAVSNACMYTAPASAHL